MREQQTVTAELCGATAQPCEPVREILTDTAGSIEDLRIYLGGTRIVFTKALVSVLAAIEACDDAATRAHDAEVDAVVADSLVGKVGDALAGLLGSLTATSGRLVVADMAAGRARTEINASGDNLTAVNSGLAVTGTNFDQTVGTICPVTSERAKQVSDGVASSSDATVEQTQAAAALVEAAAASANATIRTVDQLDGLTTCVENVEEQQHTVDKKLGELAISESVKAVDDLRALVETASQQAAELASTLLAIKSAFAANGSIDPDAISRRLQTLSTDIKGAVGMTDICTDKFSTARDSATRAAESWGATQRAALAAAKTFNDT